MPVVADGHRGTGSWGGNDYTWNGKRYYKAYCFYVPTGMNEDFEAPLRDKLREYGERKKRLVLTAEWDAGDASYNNLLERLHCSVPAIIFSNYRDPTRGNAFNVIVDRLNLVKDLPKMMTEIPLICQLITEGEYRKAVEEAAKARKKEGLKQVVNKVSSVLKHVSVTASVAGVAINTKL